MTEYPHFGPHMPCFLAFDGSVTEDRFERVVEKLCDAADAVYMAGKATTEQYVSWHEALVEWCATVKTVG